MESALPGTKADHAAKKTRSLGWLTESAMPRKRASRSIELQDGNSSAVQLKAALLQAEAEAKLHQDDPTYLLRKRARTGDIFKHKNAGVEERNRRDSALNQEESARSNDQLNAKVKLYEKMKKGELNHANSLVDFEAKGLTDEALEAAELRTGDMEHELERRRWEKEALMEIKTGIALSKSRRGRPANGVKQKYDYTLSEEQKEILSKVSAETVAARTKTNSATDKRKALLLARKQKLLKRKQNRNSKLASLFKNKAQATANKETTTQKQLQTQPQPSPSLQSNNSSKNTNNNNNDNKIAIGRDGQVLKAYDYRPPSPTELPESRPNPHREYAAIAPPKSLTATLNVIKNKNKKRIKQTDVVHQQPQPAATPDAMQRSEAQSFLNSLQNNPKLNANLNNHAGFRPPHYPNAAYPYPHPSYNMNMNIPNPYAYAYGPHYGTQYYPYSYNPAAAAAAAAAAAGGAYGGPRAQSYAGSSSNSNGNHNSGYQKQEAPQTAASSTSKCSELGTGRAQGVGNGKDGDSGSGGGSSSRQEPAARGGAAADGMHPDRARMLGLL